MVVMYCEQSVINSLVFDHRAIHDILRIWTKIWLQSHHVILLPYPSMTVLWVDPCCQSQKGLITGEHFILLTPERSSLMGGKRPGLLPGAGLHPHQHTGYRPLQGHSYLPAWLGVGDRSSLPRDGLHRSSSCPRSAEGSHVHSGCTPGMAGTT